jgi:TP901 family phage tail tape measure protein
LANERVVKVKLAATVDQYNAAMAQAAKKTREVGTEGEKLAQTQKAFDLVSRSALAMGGLAAAGLGVAIAKFADFDQAMSNVAATGSDARGSLEDLRDAALEAGASTVYSATEAANAIEELAKAGVSAKDVLSGGLDGALDLAAAGGIGVADAAGIAATALKTFNLEGGEMSHVADLLAAGAGKAMGSVGDLSAALNQSALIASNVGLSIEETTAGLAAFASQGLLGSDAGTSFKTMLLALNPTSAEAAELMKELKLEAYDQGGAFVGLSEYAGKLETALGGMSAEQQSATLKTIFGNDAYRAAAVLLDEGKRGIEDWTEAVDDQGYAAETAAERLNNLKGDLEALSGAFETGLINMGSAADGPLRSIVQDLTGLVDGFNALPIPAQQAAFWVGAAGAAALLAGGVYLVGVPKVAAYNAALATLGTTAQRTGRLLAAAGKGVGIAAGVAVGVTAASDALVGYARELRGTDEAIAKATTTNQSFLESMDDVNKTTGTTAESIKLALNAIDTGDTFGAVGYDVLSLRDGLTEVQKGFEGIPLQDSVKKFRAWGDELGLSKAQMGTLLGEIPTLEGAIRDQLKATGGAADAQSVLNFALKDSETPAKIAADAIADVAAEAEVAAENLDKMDEALDNVGRTASDMAAATDDALGAINGMASAALAEEVSLGGANDASIALRDSMRDVEQAHKDSAQAILDNAGSFEEARAEWAKGREAIILQRIAMGESREEATVWADSTMGNAADVELALRNYASTVEQLPDKQVLTLVADTAPAEEAIRGLIYDYEGAEIGLVINADGSQGYDFGGGMIARASGGAIYGPGSGTSDSVIARLSNGEHVWTAAEVDAAGGHTAVEDMRKWVLSGGDMMTSRSGGRGGGGSDGWGGTSVTLNQTINPSTGMSEEQIGRVAAERTAFALRGA